MGSLALVTWLLIATLAQPSYATFFLHKGCLFPNKGPVEQCTGCCTEVSAEFPYNYKLKPWWTLTYSTAWDVSLTDCPATALLSATLPNGAVSTLTSTLSMNCCAQKTPTLPTPPQQATMPGATVTRPGVTVTQPASTVTLPGVTVTQPGTSVTETVNKPGTTVLSTVVQSQPGTTVTVTQPGVPGQPQTVTVTQPGQAQTVTVTQPGQPQTVTVTQPEKPEKPQTVTVTKPGKPGKDQTVTVTQPDLSQCPQPSTCFQNTVTVTSMPFLSSTSRATTPSGTSTGLTSSTPGRPTQPTSSFPCVSQLPQGTGMYGSIEQCGQYCQQVEQAYGSSPKDSQLCQLVSSTAIYQCQLCREFYNLPSIQTLAGLVSSGTKPATQTLPDVVSQVASVYSTLIEKCSYTTQGVSVCLPSQPRSTSSGPVSPTQPRNSSPAGSPVNSSAHSPESSSVSTSTAVSLSDSSKSTAKVSSPSSSQTSAVPSVCVTDLPAGSSIYGTIEQCSTVAQNLISQIKSCDGSSDCICNVAKSEKFQQASGCVSFYTNEKVKPVVTVVQAITDAASIISSIAKSCHVPSSSVSVCFTSLPGTLMSSSTQVVHNYSSSLPVSTESAPQSTVIVTSIPPRTTITAGPSASIPIPTNGLTPGVYETTITSTETQVIPGQTLVSTIPGTTDAGTSVYSSVPGITKADITTLVVYTRICEFTVGAPNTVTTTVTLPGSSALPTAGVVANSTHPTPGITFGSPSSVPTSADSGPNNQGYVSTKLITIGVPGQNLTNPKFVPPPGDNQPVESPPSTITQTFVVTATSIIPGSTIPGTTISGFSSSGSVVSGTTIPGSAQKPSTVTTVSTITRIVTISPTEHKTFVKQPEATSAESGPSVMTVVTTIYPSGQSISPNHNGNAPHLDTPSSAITASLESTVPGTTQQPVTITSTDSQGQSSIVTQPGTTRGPSVVTIITTVYLSGVAQPSNGNQPAEVSTNANTPDSTSYITIRKTLTSIVPGKTVPGTTVWGSIAEGSSLPGSTVPGITAHPTTIVRTVTETISAVPSTSDFSTPGSGAVDSSLNGPQYTTSTTLLTVTSTQPEITVPETSVPISTIGGTTFPGSVIPGTTIPGETRTVVQTVVTTVTASAVLPSSNRNLPSDSPSDSFGPNSKTITTCIFTVTSIQPGTTVPGTLVPASIKNGTTVPGSVIHGSTIAGKTETFVTTITTKVSNGQSVTMPAKITGIPAKPWSNTTNSSFVPSNTRPASLSAPLNEQSASSASRSSSLSGTDSAPSSSTLFSPPSACISSTEMGEAVIGNIQDCDHACTQLVQRFKKNPNDCSVISESFVAKCNLCSSFYGNDVVKSEIKTKDKTLSEVNKIFKKLNSKCQLGVASVSVCYGSSSSETISKSSALSMGSTSFGTAVSTTGGSAAFSSLSSASKSVSSYAPVTSPSKSVVSGLSSSTISVPSVCISSPALASSVVGSPEQCIQACSSFSVNYDKNSQSPCVLRGDSNLAVCNLCVSYYTNSAVQVSETIQALLQNTVPKVSQILSLLSTQCLIETASVSVCLPSTSPAASSSTASSPVASSPATSSSPVSSAPVSSSPNEFSSAASSPISLTTSRSVPSTTPTSPTPGSTPGTTSAPAPSKTTSSPDFVTSVWTSETAWTVLDHPSIMSIITEAPQTYAVTLSGLATVTGVVTSNHVQTISQVASMTISAGNNQGGTYGGVSSCLQEFSQCCQQNGKLGLLTCKKVLLECKCRNGVSLCCGIKQKLLGGLLH